MAETKSAAKVAKRSPASRVTNKMSAGFTEEERAAIREYAQEKTGAGRRGSPTDKEDGERAVLAKIAEMPLQDRVLA